MSDLTIGALAKCAGVGVETIRFYERQRLIEQPRKPMEGFRHYPAETVIRVRFIRQAKKLGFSLQEIGELLDLSINSEQNCNEIRLRAETKITAISSKIETLDKMKGVLSQLVVACNAQNQRQSCPIIESIIEESLTEGEK
ncbi:MAG: MerR family DNA-binding protein [Desulfuromusa sp.]